MLGRYMGHIFYVHKQLVVMDDVVAVVIPYYWMQLYQRWYLGILVLSLIGSPHCDAHIHDDIVALSL